VGNNQTITNGYIWKMDAGVGSILTSSNQGNTWDTEFYTPYFEIYQNTVVEFYDGDPDHGGIFIGSDYLPPIAPSDSDIASVEWTTTSGTHNIWVVVDPTDDVSESNETNNKDSKSITVETILGVSVSPDAWDIGIVEDGSVTTMTSEESITVTNNGNVSEVFTLKVTDTGGTWSVGTTYTGNTHNTFVIGGIFASTSDTIVANDFIEDPNYDVIITEGEKSAGAKTFTCENSSENGVDVPVSGERALWLQFKAPTTTSTFDKQNIVIMVGAQAF